MRPGPRPPRAAAPEGAEGAGRAYLAPDGSLGSPVPDLAAFAASPGAAGGGRDAERGEEEAAAAGWACPAARQGPDAAGLRRRPLRAPRP